MSVEPTERAAASPAEPGLRARFPGKYLSLTSFKKDGTGVATPVWFVINDGRLLVQTDPQSFKARRIRANPCVTIAPCSASGRLRGEPIPATAEFLPAGDRDHLRQLLARKYRIDRILTAPLYRLVQRLRGRPPGRAEIGLAITPASKRSNPTHPESGS